MTIIEIPDDLADRLRAEAAARGEDLNNYAIAKLEKPAEEEEVDDDLIESLREGIADDDAGRVLTLEELDNHVYGLLSGKADKGIAA